MKKKFGIYAWPAFATKEFNPYNYLIYDNVRKLGYPVYEFRFKIKRLWKLIISNEYKILHFHWPRRDLLTANTFIKASAQVIVFYFFIKLIKLFNKKIVWTVHNLKAHEDKFPFLQEVITAILYRNVNGFISMNEMGLRMIREKTKSIKQHITYIPHPAFKNYYPDNLTKQEARAKLKIPPEKFVFLFLGLIKPYKNVPALVDAFQSVKAKNKQLVIAGLVRDAVLSDKITEGSADVMFYNSFVKDEDLQIFFNAADLVVTPYKNTFNSGSVFLNLSFNKPTLAPDIGAFTELKSYFGSRWIKTYSGNISAEILEKTMKEVIEENIEGLKPPLEQFDPEVIAAKTVAFYQSLL